MLFPKLVVVVVFLRAVSLADVLLVHEKVGFLLCSWCSGSSSWFIHILVGAGSGRRTLGGARQRRSGELALDLVHHPTKLTRTTKLMEQIRIKRVTGQPSRG